MISIIKSVYEQWYFFFKTIRGFYIFQGFFSSQIKRIICKIAGDLHSKNEPQIQDGKDFLKQFSASFATNTHKPPLNVLKDTIERRVFIHGGEKERGIHRNYFFRSIKTMKASLFFLTAKLRTLGSPFSKKIEGLSILFTFITLPSLRCNSFLHTQ